MVKSYFRSISLTHSSCSALNHFFSKNKEVVATSFEEVKREAMTQRLSIKNKILKWQFDPSSNNPWYPRPIIRKNPKESLLQDKSAVLRSWFFHAFTSISPLLTSTRQQSAFFFFFGKRTLSSQTPNIKHQSVQHPAQEVLFWGSQKHLMLMSSFIYEENETEKWSDLPVAQRAHLHVELMRLSKRSTLNCSQAQSLHIYYCTVNNSAVG